MSQPTETAPDSVLAAYKRLVDEMDAELWKQARQLQEADELAFVLNQRCTALADERNKLRSEVNRLIGSLLAVRQTTKH